jgi:Cellulase (glycosyl hydrolase family 5)
MPGRPLLFALLVAACASSLVAGASARAQGRTDAARPAVGLHVSGNRLLNGKGQVVRFHGINRAGTEYTCIQGGGIFDGPNDAKSIRAMVAWHVNAVRIPLNEDCWLGINGVRPEDGGANYRRAIVDYVQLLRKHQIYPELALMWAAPGSVRATYQPGAPDADHAPAFWSSLAATFKSYHNVVLSPWGETYVDANCFLRGGCKIPFNPSNPSYTTAGMQQAVTVMRKAGYTGVIAISGLSFGNDLTKWLSHKPVDPRHQLVAEAHVYGKQVCATPTCFDKTYAPVARRVPVIFGETGETYDASACGSDHISTILNWADAHGVGYETWTWNTWGNCSALIRDYAGTPFSAYGAWVKSHYARRK